MVTPSVDSERRHVDPEGTLALMRVTHSRVTKGPVHGSSLLHPHPFSLPLGLHLFVSPSFLLSINPGESVFLLICCLGAFLVSSCFVCRAGMTISVASTKEVQWFTKVTLWTFIPHRVYQFWLCVPIPMCHIPLIKDKLYSSDAHTHTDFKTDLSPLN